MTDFARCLKPEGGPAHAITAPHLNMRSRSPIRWSRADAEKNLGERVANVGHLHPVISVFQCLMVFLVVFNCVSTSDNADLTRYDVCVTDNRRNLKRKDGVVLLHLLRVFLSPREIFSRWDQFLLQSGSLASSISSPPSSHDPSPRRHRCLH